MDEITYDNVYDLDEFRNKKRINTDCLPRLTIEQRDALFPPCKIVYRYDLDFPEKGIYPYPTTNNDDHFSPAS